jgi:hypothetical protein
MRDNEVSLVVYYFLRLIVDSPIEPEPTLNFVVYLNNNISLKILSEIISLVVVFKNKF